MGERIDVIIMLSYYYKFYLLTFRKNTKKDQTDKLVLINVYIF